MSKKTELALIARGIDASTSQNLACKGYTIQKLYHENIDNLMELGLSTEQVLKLGPKSRPPIPTNILHNLLYRSAHTCCICRDKTQPIIVHHLDEWAASKSHDINNLVVLCLNCHAKAHSKSTISVNLSKKHLVAAKSEWEETVKNKESKAIFEKSSWNVLDGMWDYFNHSRIIDTVYQLGIDPTQISGYEDLYAKGAINSDGSYIWPSTQAPLKEELHFMYQGGLRGIANARANYYANIVKKILNSTNFIDLTYGFTKSASRNLVHVNDVVCVTGGHHFKSFHGIDSRGPGQMREGYRQANGLRLIFKFDAWETTSSSSHGDHLHNMWRCTSISIIRSISFAQKMNVANCTCLAIGTGFTEYMGKVPRIAKKNDSNEEWDEDHFDEEASSPDGA